MTEKITRELIQGKIDLMIDNLIHISDPEGKYLLHFGDIVVDDKSWKTWNWPQGVGLYGIYKNYKITKNPAALKAVNDWFDQALEAGAPGKNVNMMCPLLAMACLYEDFGDSRYVPYLKRWAQWAMIDMPRTTNGGMAHCTIQDAHLEQLWDDTLMMTVLPLAKIGKIFNIPEYVEEAKKQFLIHAEYLMDKKTGLWFHGWNFNRRDNYAGALWARGNCWITIAIPEIIEILDLKKGEPITDWLLALLNTQIKALASLQDESGLWHTLLNDPDSYVESSGSAGIAYGILKAVHERYVDPKYAEVAEKAIRGLLKQIDENGEVQNVSVGTGLEDDLDYYRNIDKTSMPYGQSLTVLAFTEYLISFM